MNELEHKKYRYQKHLEKFNAMTLDEQLKVIEENNKYAEKMKKIDPHYYYNCELNPYKYEYIGVITYSLKQGETNCDKMVGNGAAPDGYTFMRTVKLKMDNILGAVWEHTFGLYKLHLKEHL
jgi:hypothetical protein